MEYRVGKCSSCGVHYKIPTSFTASRAKCPECTKGAVEIEADVRTDAPDAAQQPVAATDTPESKPKPSTPAAEAPKAPEVAKAPETPKAPEPPKVTKAPELPKPKPQPVVAKKVEKPTPRPELAETPAAASPPPMPKAAPEAPAMANSAAGNPNWTEIRRSVDSAGASALPTTKPLAPTPAPKPAAAKEQPQATTRPIPKREQPKAAPPTPKPKAPAMAKTPKQPATDKDAWDEIPMKNKRREGPTMKEKLMARRVADAEAARGAEAPKPAAAAPEARNEKPARRAAAKASAPKTSRRDAAKPARASARKTDEADGEEAERKPAARSASKRASAGASRKRASTGSAKGARKGSKGRDKSSDTDNKRSPIPMLVGVVVLAGGGFGAWKYLGAGAIEGGDADVVQAAEGNLVDATTGNEDAAAAGTTDGVETASLGAGTPNPAADATPEAGTGEATGDAPVADANPGSASATEGGAAGAKPDGTTPDADVKSPAVTSGNDPASIDLTGYEDFEALPGTSSDDWNEIQELANTFLDQEAGAAGKRAERALVEHGKKAFPAIVNKLRAIDFSTKTGYRDGDIAQKLLMTIANGKNLGWKYSTEDKDVVYNKKVVRLWIQVWERSAESDQYWLEFTGLEPEEAEEDASGLDDAALDDLDDLDDI
ncbi:MAG: hypothetical protein ACI8QZ_002311 [Chlamydiales bacterium]|jgi:hypothetical protein